MAWRLLKSQARAPSLGAHFPSLLKLAEIPSFEDIPGEAEARIELANDGFANHCLTGWLLRRTHDAAD